MEREILFKGKRVDNGEWIEGMLIYFFDNKGNSMIMPSCYFGTRDFGDEDEDENPIISEHIAVGGFINVKPETVSQFTGLTDKNGVKIFEGDKLKTDAFNYTYIVEFTYNAFNCYHETLKDWDGSKLKWGGIWRFKELGFNIEVIGNVYD